MLFVNQLKRKLGVTWVQGAVTGTWPSVSDEK